MLCYKEAMHNLNGILQLWDEVTVKEPPSLCSVSRGANFLPKQKVDKQRNSPRNYLTAKIKQITANKRYRLLC